MELQLQDVFDLLQWTIISVTLNMLLTLLIWIGIYGMEPNSKLSGIYFLGMSASYTTGNDTIDGFLNGFGTVCILGIVSFVMLAFALFDFRRVVKCWLTLSCLLILFGISASTAHEACQTFIDQSTEEGYYVSIFISVLVSLCYGSLGMIAFFTDSPIWLHQFFVITNCSLIAVFYLRAFPHNTPWFVLWGVVFWDVFAVLAPMGPLKRVQEKAEDYSNNVLRLLMFTAKNDGRTSAGSDVQSSVQELIRLYSRQDDESFEMRLRERRRAINPDTSSTDKMIDTCSTASTISVNCVENGTFDEEMEQVTSSDEGTLVDEPAPQVEHKMETAADALNDGDSVRLGFGDFVFYSLLIGHAATSTSVLATFAAGFGIIIGLIATLTVFSSSEHTIPALPLSVAMGSICYFVARVLQMTSFQQAVRVFLQELYFMVF